MNGNTVPNNIQLSSKDCQRVVDLLCHVEQELKDICGEGAKAAWRPEIIHNENLTFTAEEAAKQLNVSLPTIYQLCNREDFPAMRIGKKLLVSRSGLERWIEAQTREVQ